MDAKFAENHKFIQDGGRINVVPSLKIVYKVNCDVNCVYIIYLLCIIYATIKLVRLVIVCVAKQRQIAKMP